MIEQQTASDYFGAMTASYDSLIRRAVPRYDEMLATLLDYLPPAADRIMELGCGTGNHSLSLAARYPKAQLFFVDAAPEMLELTRSRLMQSDPAAVERSMFLEKRFEELDGAAGELDLITSTISLHHVRDKLPMYRSLHGLLREGGIFRFSDQIRGATEEIHEHNWTRWLEFCRLPGHCTEEEIQSLLDHAEAHDFYTPLAEHFALLEEAGFRDLDCVWRNLIWGIVVARQDL